MKTFALSICFNGRRDLDIFEDIEAETAAAAVDATLIAHGVVGFRGRILADRKFGPTFALDGAWGQCGVIDVLDLAILDA